MAAAGEKQAAAILLKIINKLLVSLPYICS